MRRLVIGLVAILAVPLLVVWGQPAPQLEWSHGGTSVTHFECWVDGAYGGNLGLPTPDGQVYSANLSLCGAIAAGAHAITVKACNYTNCTATATTLPLVAQSAVGSGTHACVGPDQTAVQNAVNAATYGDRVSVCAGSATWTGAAQGCASNSMLCIKKGIYLVGGIGGTTTITFSGSAPGGPIAYQPDATARTNDTPFSVTGFTFDAGGVDYAYGMVDIYNPTTTLLTKITIHHNTFKNATVSGHAIVVNGPVYGVAYANTLIDVSTQIKVEGGGASSWDLNHRAYGTANSFFYEDNTLSFTNNTTTDYGWTSGQGGGMVARYNTINAANNTGGDELGDLHGLQSMSRTYGAACDGTGCYNTDACFSTNTSATPCCNETSQVKSELYGNRWLNKNVGTVYWIVHRGSWMLMFNNDMTGTYAGSYLPNPKYWQVSCDSCARYASAYSQHVQNTYVFNNRYNATDRPLLPHGNWGVPGESPDPCSEWTGEYTITENVDYFNLDATFDGTTGVGCGTLASRPVTCTTGVGYWATNQSCSDMTGMVGASPATPISGTLYKCTATNTWTSYYTPYTYPHPKAATPTAATSVRLR